MSRSLSCLISVRVDFNFSDPCYVLQLASNYKPAHTDCVLAAALSNNQIKVFNHSSADLQNVCSLQGHSDRVTDVSVPLLHSPWLVLSSSEDKTIKLWDTRGIQVAEEFTCPSGELYCCSGSDNVVAGGSDGTVWFWDRRKQQVLQRLDDTHMDMVTVCEFHARRPQAFFSGSDDGLIAAFDFSNGINEEDAFVAALNIRNSPVELSFMGHEDGMLWCRTAAETVHLWNWSQSVSEQAVDYMAVEEDPEARLDSCDMMDVREQLNDALNLDPGSFKGQVDYVVSCHRADNGTIYVVAGSNEGSLALLQMLGDGDVSTARIGRVAMHLCGGHMDVVRSALVHGEVIVTGGEDARICLWGDADALEERMLQGAIEGAGGAVAAPSLSPPRHKPY